MRTPGFLSKALILVILTLLKMAYWMRDRWLCVEILHLLRSPLGARGMTAPEIAVYMPFDVTCDFVEELLNHPLATGEVAGFVKRFCTVTQTLKTVYWIKKNHLYEDL